MNLCKHSQNQLYHKAEVSYSKPGHCPIAERCSDMSGFLFDLHLVKLFLLVVLVVSRLLLLEVFFVLIVEFSRFRCCHNFEKTEWTRQVFDVVLDKLVLFDIAAYVVSPFAVEMLEVGDV